MFEAQNQSEFPQNDWHAALEQAVDQLMELLEAKELLDEEIEAQLAVVRLFQALSSPPE